MKINQRGFTLVEALIVVAIIAILAAVAIPGLLRSRINAQEASAQANLKLIANALENYAAINSLYPTTTTALMGVTPPYLSVDYFNGAHNGYTFAHSFNDYSYLITASPTPVQAGMVSFTIATGGVITRF